MITFEEASRIIFEQKIEQLTEIVGLEQAAGRILAEAVVADRDMPPFDRVSMDGIAINFNDYENGLREWLCIKTQYAGEPAITLNIPGHCVEVMTGAVLPVGCNVVIRYEDLEVSEINSGERRFKLQEAALKKFQNIHGKGSDKLSNEIILEKGQCINATDIALLATVGKKNILVYKSINVAIISTGDELTAVDASPEIFQIRASNHMMIAAALKELSVECDRFLVRDEIQELKQLLDQCIKHYQIVVITGAVSKGKADFIPAVLSQLKVEKLFHGIAQRPAKPFWFGRKNNCVVFALPGNPVSAAVCTYVYLTPFVKWQMGKNIIKLKCYVQEEVIFKPQLTYFMQAKISQNDQGDLMAFPFQGNGSGDLTNLSDIDAFVKLPAQESQFSKSKLYELYFTRNIL